ncbi:hypothetical protein, partial [Mucilaginibacter sp.]|uniref:hypothetical protein n=1 Tax=Mucilaginibacter sp. TaxID=1882438 RepID=UPI002ED30AB7
MKKQLLGVIAASAVIFSSCHDDHKIIPFKYPDMAEAQNPAVLFTTANGVKVYNGGFGSAVAADPAQRDVLYLLTDRGSNVAGQAANSIIIGKPDFDPQIGK